MSTRPLVLPAIIALAVATAPADARRSRSHVGWHTRPDAARADGFVCGTYKDNHREVGWHHALYQAALADRARGRASLSPANNFVYDDVYVIEDDGTVLITGNNTFDTINSTIRFTPNAAGGYDVSLLPFTWAVHILHATIPMADDDSETRALGFGFPFYATTWDSVSVGSNGNAVFGGSAAPTGFFDPNDFWGENALIAPYAMDLNPANSLSGDIYYEATPDSAVITWWEQKEFNSSFVNSFQLVMRSDGSFDMSYFQIQSLTASYPIIMGARPEGSPPFEKIRYSHGLPHSGAAGAGLYEDYIVVNNPIVNETGLGKAFYAAFPDSFQQYIFLTNFTQTQAGTANHLGISNQITGIGRTIYDNSAQFGSDGALEGRCNMNQLAIWPLDPYQRFLGPALQSFLSVMGQEAVHRWGAFVRFDKGLGPSNFMLGRSDAHWNYYADVDHSCLEGGDWIETVPGNYTCPGYVDYCSQLDEYLMGLRTKDEVKDYYYISSSQNNTTAQRSKPPPVPGATASGTPVDVSVEDIIAAEGLRTPLPHEELRDRRHAFILVVRNGTTPTQAELDQIATYRRAWEDYFEFSCDGRLTCNTSITRSFPVAAINGYVTDASTTLPIDNVTVRSVGRDYVQRVPAGGWYEMRYMANDTSGIAESARVVVSAPGYYADSLWISIRYGYEVPLDFSLDPVILGTEYERPLPTALYQNFPNPFNPTTTIPFDLERDGHVRLQIFDARGRLVRTLVDDFHFRGHHRLPWDGTSDAGTGVASGIYIYRLETPDFTRTRKMVLVR